MSSHPLPRDSQRSTAVTGTPPGGSVAGPSIGTRLVLGLVLLALGLAAFAVWFQWGQTRRCLAFFGPAATRRIQAGSRVEIWSLEADGGAVRASSQLDVSQAPGLVHLRRGLIEDVNYRWDAIAPDQPRLAAADWDVAIAFYGAAADEDSATVVAFDLDAGGAATVVGRPGRVALGRLTPGLRRWIEATKSQFGTAKSGF